MSPLLSAANSCRAKKLLTISLATAVLLQSAALAEPAGPLFNKTTKLKHHPALLRGYELFMAGDLAAARSEYASLLLLDSRNPDALQAMAAISLRQGQPELAGEFFLRVLASDPRNVLAQAGLTSLKGQSDSMRSQSLLKTLIAAQPDRPVLHFALGNLYAGRGLWNEARQAYLNALRTEPDNPDILFNIAVSLDRLHKPGLALNYYLRAWALADERSSGFAREMLLARLREPRQD